MFQLFECFDSLLVSTLFLFQRFACFNSLPVSTRYLFRLFDCAATGRLLPCLQFLYPRLPPAWIKAAIADEPELLFELPKYEVRDKPRPPTSAAPWPLRIHRNTKGLKGAVAALRNIFPQALVLRSHS